MGPSLALTRWCSTPSQKSLLQPEPVCLGLHFQLQPQVGGEGTISSPGDVFRSGKAGWAVGVEEPQVVLK